MEDIYPKFFGRFTFTAYHYNKHPAESMLCVSDLGRHCIPPIEHAVVGGRERGGRAVGKDFRNRASGRPVILTLRKEVPVFIPERGDIRPELQEAGGVCPGLMFLFGRVVYSLVFFREQGGTWTVGLGRWNFLWGIGTGKWKHSY